MLSIKVDLYNLISVSDINLINKLTTIIMIMSTGKAATISGASQLLK